MDKTKLYNTIFFTNQTKVGSLQKKKCLPHKIFKYMPILLIIIVIIHIVLSVKIERMLL